MPNFRRVFQDNSFVFITILINNRKRKLLTDYIENLRDAFKKSQKMVNYEIYAISVMHVHLHIIIQPKEIKDYPKIVSIIKREFTKSLPENVRIILRDEISVSKVNKRESGVWHRRYYEHTIRNEDELNHLTDYVHYNPVKHGLSKSVYDWKYSSFKKFVKLGNYDKDWCDFTEGIDYN
jgi:putative transposase